MYLLLWVEDEFECRTRQLISALIAFSNSIWSNHMLFSEVWRCRLWRLGLLSRAICVESITLLNSFPFGGFEDFTNSAHTFNPKLLEMRREASSSYAVLLFVCTIC